jgi:hypothetical protein
MLVLCVMRQRYVVLAPFLESFLTILVFIRLHLKRRKDGIQSLDGGRLCLSRSCRWLWHELTGILNLQAVNHLYP